MMGIAEKFDRALPDLETFLEAEAARGETREPSLPLKDCFISSNCWQRDKLRVAAPPEQTGRNRRCGRSHQEGNSRS
jgi:hypothetical protein